MSKKAGIAAAMQEKMESHIWDSYNEGGYEEKGLDRVDREEPRRALRAIYGAGFFEGALYMIRALRELGEKIENAQSD